MHTTAAPPRRVVLKIDGLTLGSGGMGICVKATDMVAQQIAELHKHGFEVAIVVGGGNFMRGAELEARGMDRPRADYMGMLGTVMTGLALQSALEHQGLEVRMQSAIPMPQVARQYIAPLARSDLAKGRVVMLVAGAGVAYMTTDVIAVQRALELGAHEVLIGKYKLTRAHQIDVAARGLCAENKLTMRVFRDDKPGEIVRQLLKRPTRSLVATAQ